MRTNNLIGKAFQPEGTQHVQNSGGFKDQMNMSLEKLCVVLWLNYEMNMS